MQKDLKKKVSSMLSSSNMGLMANSELKADVEHTETDFNATQVKSKIKKEPINEGGSRCSVIILLVLMFFTSVCYLSEIICPFYFDAQINKEGLKLAGLLGAEFELQKESPYYNPERQRRFQGPDSAKIKDLPHAVKKKSPDTEDKSKDKDKKGGLFGGNRKTEVPRKGGAPYDNETIQELDDLGLAAPGTRNISISHLFRYFNYSEINLLNTKPEYYYEKLNNNS